MSFSEKMKIIRQKRRLSQTKLEILSGVSQSAISAIERGEKSPTEETMRLISAALRVPLVEMLSDEKSPTAEGDEAEKAELINALVSLKPEEVQRVRDFVAGLLASQAKEPDSPAKDA